MWGRAIYPVPVPGMDTPLQPLDWNTLLGTWQWRPVWTLAIILAALAYAAGLRAANRRGRPSVTPLRVVFFAAALVVLWVTVSSAIAVYGEVLFWMHMVGHLMLIMVVPVLLVLGRPLTVLVAATDGRAERVLHFRVVTLLTLPVCALVLYAAVIIGTHLTGFMGAMTHHAWLMSLEEVLYVAGGWVLMQALIGGEPLRSTAPLGPRLFLSVVAMVPDTLVGIVLLQSGTDSFSAMTRARPAWAPGPIRDAQIGGGLMWVGGDLLMMLVSVGLILTLISSPGRDRMLGARLDGARANALLEHINQGTTTEDRVTRRAFGETADVDADDEVLAAYNKMLGRLSRHPD